jgi:RHS repeat-associated protein
MYAFDALERLISSRTFNTSGTAVVRSTHEYDGLDRPIKARECHDLSECEGSSWWTSGREAKLRYLGSSSLVAREDVSGAARTSKLKMYSYDPGGGRSAVETTNLSNTVADYTYAYDAHGSVALLVTDERSVQASYGYDPYGGEDETLTKELKQGSTTVITDPDDPLNAYRYTGKREDTGSGTLDMGARRFAPDTGRFISSDFYTDALADTGLSTDPLTQNRYALAGGNPVGYVESDGHRPLGPHNDTDKTAATNTAVAHGGSSADVVQNCACTFTGYVSPTYTPPPPESPGDFLEHVASVWWDHPCLGRVYHDLSAPGNCVAGVGSNAKDDASEIAGDLSSGDPTQTLKGAGKVALFALPLKKLKWLRFESKFGSLQYADEGIKPFKTQRSVTAGHGGDIQAHHLIEQRFAPSTWAPAASHPTSADSSPATSTPTRSPTSGSQPTRSLRTGTPWQAATQLGTWRLMVTRMWKVSRIRQSLKSTLFPEERFREAEPRALEMTTSQVRVVAFFQVLRRTQRTRRLYPLSLRLPGLHLAEKSWVGGRSLFRAMPASVAPMRMYTSRFPGVRSRSEAMTFLSVTTCFSSQRSTPPPEA